MTHEELLTLVTERDFMDFPTAWAIQENEQLSHNGACSSVEGSNHGMGGSMFLCDCGGLVERWDALRREAGATE